MDVAEPWEVEPESLTDEELTACLRELDQVRSRSEAAMARVLAVWDARKAWADDGATSATSWLAYRCELSRSSAAVMVRTARRLRSMPLTSAATEAGEICFAKAVLLASAAHRSEKTVKAFARHEAMLVEHARRLTVDQTAQLLRHWLLRADPDGGGGPHSEGDRSHVSTTFEGATALDRLYTSEEGAVVKAAIDAEYERLWRAERSSGGPVRTPAQRRAAALAEVVRRAVGSEPGRPTISVTIGLDDLVRGRGSGSADDSGEPVSAQAARRLACDARVVPVVLGKAGEPLDVGRASRAISSAQRRELIIRDRGCVFPGCDRPPGWCDGHHIVHWADGGSTDLTTTTRPCTRAAGRWPARPTAASRSGAPTARPWSRRDSRAKARRRRLLRRRCRG